MDPGSTVMWVWGLQGTRRGCLGYLGSLGDINLTGCPYEGEWQVERGVAALSLRLHFRRACQGDGAGFGGGN